MYDYDDYEEEFEELEERDTDWYDEDYFEEQRIEKYYASILDWIQVKEEPTDKGIKKTFVSPSELRIREEYLDKEGKQYCMTQGAHYRRENGQCINVAKELLEEANIK